MEKIIISVSQEEDNLHSGYKALWRMSEEDAKKLCSDPRTQGPKHFLAFINPSEWVKPLKDNGKYADVLSELDIKTFPL